MKILILVILFSTGIAFAQTPVLFYTDLTTGMCSGGENSKGHWMWITGNNFGPAQDGTHYVKITPAGGGGATTLDTYKYWTTLVRGSQTYYRIAVQLGTGGGCVADGDYNIQVVTPSGTSNSLPIHIYSGATIYFADPNNVSCNNGGSGTYAAPFCSVGTCRQKAFLAAGNACYIMPGTSWKTTDPDNFGYITLAHQQVGTAQKYNWILGYPTTNNAQIPIIGCDINEVTADCTAHNPALRTYDSKYFGVGHLNLLYSSPGSIPNSSPSGCYAAVDTLSPYYDSYYRLIDLGMSTGGGYNCLTIQTNGTTFAQFYGLWFHDYSSGSTDSNKHNGSLYIAERTHDLDVGWNTFDSSCLYTPSTPCHNYKQLEFHMTASGNSSMGTPTIQAGSGSSRGDVTAVSGGSLTAGTYDVQVTYKQQVYPNGDTGSWATPSVRETLPSSKVTLTLNGTTQTAIQIAWPTGADHPPGGSLDGSTTFCNPALTYRAYICKESAGACTTQYQSEVAYTNTNVYNGSTSTNYTQTAALTTGTSVPGSDTTDTTGCTAYNLAIHDSQFLNGESYAWGFAQVTAQNQGYVRLYNNVIGSAGTYGAAIQGSDPDYISVCISHIFDNNGRQLYVAGNPVEIYNNTFYNCAPAPASAGQTEDPSILYAAWQSGAPTITFSFKNNLFYKFPKTIHSGTTNASNVVGSGSNNLCYGTTLQNCPDGTGTFTFMNWSSSGGGLNIPPVITAAGTPVSDPNAGASPGGACGVNACGTGGTIYTGYDLSPQSGSPLRGAGVAPSFTITYDINGNTRPNPPSIGAYEYQAAGGGTTGTVRTTGTIQTTGTVMQ
jgi:hypothetical protein